MSKVSWKDIFEGFQVTVFKNKFFYEKRCTAWNHFDVMQSQTRFTWSILSTSQGNGSEMTYVAGLRKWTPKLLRQVTGMQVTIWGHQLKIDGRFKPFSNSNRYLKSYHLRKSRQQTDLKTVW